MGAPYEAARPEDGKPRRVRITQGFYIDQYEVTVEQFAKFMRAQGKRCLGDSCVFLGSEPTIDTSSVQFAIQAGAERHPIDAVRLSVAVDYCSWVGKRVPTEAQWELAARHEPTTQHDRLYPWGDAYEHGTTNCAPETCHDGFELTSPVGAMRRDRSPVGAFDMGGNVSEWVNDCYRKDPGCDPCIDPSVTSGCEQACDRSRPTPRCGDQSLQRGGGNYFDPVKAKARVRAFAWVGGGIRCVSGPRNPPG